MILITVMSDSNILVVEKLVLRLLQSYLEFTIRKSNHNLH